MVNLLLSKGANINAFDKKDGRALHWAAFMGKSVLCVRFALTIMRHGSHFYNGGSSDCRFRALQKGSIILPQLRI